MNTAAEHRGRNEVPASVRIAELELHRSEWRAVAMTLLTALDEIAAATDLGAAVEIARRAALRARGEAA